MVVVYKIDRLTRSLTDFSKLVEVFDQHEVTFVSVTQSFNTTTSMGRLTLNVLLSFAQFEREVTGERIRDKIAASKKKGMWMGGCPPLGYQLIDKKLVPNVNETKVIQFIFEQYAECPSVRILIEKLIEKGYRTASRISTNGRIYGNRPLSRGHLYRILQNPVYTGKISHKGSVFDGQHKAIIDDMLFDKVKNLMKENTSKRALSENLESGSLLKGLLYDCEGTIYSPSFTSKKNKRYYYYISQNLIQYRNHPKGALARIPAHEIEKVVIHALQDWCNSCESWQKIFPAAPEKDLIWLSNNMNATSYNLLHSITNQICVHSNHIEIKLNSQKLVAYTLSQKNMMLCIPSQAEIIISEHFQITKGRDGAILIESQQKTKDPLDLPPERIKRIVRGIIWRDEHFNGAPLQKIATTYGHGENYVNRCIQESFELLNLPN